MELMLQRDDKKRGPVRKKFLFKRLSGFERIAFRQRVKNRGLYLVRGTHKHNKCRLLNKTPANGLLLRLAPHRNMGRHRKSGPRSKNKALTRSSKGGSMMW